MDTINDKGNIPKNIYGWSVYVKRGYYNLSKTYNGKSHCIRMGKKFDKKVAKNKIIEREIEMLNDIVDKQVNFFGDSKFKIRLSYNEKNPPPHRNCGKH